MHEAIKYFDFSVLCGHRDEDEQNAAYLAGNSNAMWPDSAHNTVPSKAIDIAPYPINFNDIDRFFEMAALVLEVAIRQGVKLVWGGNYPIRQVADFFDGSHFEEI